NRLLQTVGGIKMESMKYGDTHKLPISQNIIRQMSFSTIRNTMDAVVELVTNSDDSYRRLEQENTSATGNISISISRLKGGLVRNLVVRDNAEGMDRLNLEKAIKFAEPASGIKEGKTVRGCFGRGLKEAIISLGRGRVDTIRNNRHDSVEVWWDKGTNEGQYHLLEHPIEATDEIRKKMGIPTGNGTVVTIDVDNPKIKCPDYQTFNYQLSCHYALRDINSSANRNVILVFYDWKGVRTVAQISYLAPIGELIETKTVNIESFGDQIQV
ncbi:unnamed protein product, partial [marine sediment metagenome]